MNSKTGRRIAEMTREGSQVVYGVAAANQTSGTTVSVYVAGSATAVTVPVLDGVTVGTDDYCVIARTGADLLVVGVVGSGAVNVETTNVTMDTGWSLSGGGYTCWRSGNVLNFAVGFTRTGSTITATASGDVANTIVCWLPTTQRGTPSNGQTLSSNSQGPLLAGLYLATTGAVYVTAVSAGATGVVSGASYSLGGTVLL